ncbi:hypothetical protein IGK99_002406 [Enterococcus sp. DIV1059_1]
MEDDNLNFKEYLNKEESLAIEQMIQIHEKLYLMRIQKIKSFKKSGKI